MGLIPEEIISQIIDRCDIVDIISSYIPLKKAGRNFKANCPFHNEKTASFIVNPDKQIFHCFGCGIGGNVVSFIMKQEHVEFPEAIHFLAKKVNIIIPENISYKSNSLDSRHFAFNINELAVNYFHNNLIFNQTVLAKSAREYLKKRNISLETAKNCKLGFALDQWDGLIKFLKGKNITYSEMEKAGLIIPRDSKEGFYDRFRNRIIFPIFDTKNHCRAFGARSLGNDDGAKYINSPETSIYIKGHHLYGFHLAKDFIIKDDYVIVVEGYMDFLMPYQAGIKNVVAALGTALTTEQIRLLRRYTKNIVMLFDSDNAGISAMLRSLDTLIDEGMEVKVASLEKDEDPDSFLQKYGVNALLEKIKDSHSLFEFKLGYLLKKYNSKTVEGKAKISTEMLITIDKFDNEISRSEYVKRLASSIVVSEQALINELDKIKNMELKKHIKLTPQEKIIQDKAPRAVERDIVRLLLEEDRYIKATKESVSISDFQDVRIRQIISKIFEMFERNKKVNVGSLISSFEDKSTQQMVCELVAKENIVHCDKEKMHRDYVEKIKKDKIKLQRKELLHKIMIAESSGDNETLEKLKKEFNQLSKI